MARIKQISSVSTSGVATFTDGDTTSAGTEADCKYYGGNFRNSKCYVRSAGARKADIFGGISKGKPVVSGDIKSTNSNNTNITGKNHRLTNADNTTVIGNKADVSLNSSLVIGGGATLGRTQKSVLMFEGRTVLTASPTELYLGGVSGERFEIDERYNRLVLALDIHATMKQVSATHAVCGYMHSNAVFQSTASVLAINGSHTALFASSGMSTSVIVLTVVAGTPDYIKVHVVGDRLLTQDWSVVINVYEIKTNAV
jgi:hypothetical protein